MSEAPELARSDDAPAPRSRWLAGVLLFLVACVAHSPAVLGGFAMDDAGEMGFRHQDTAMESVSPGGTAGPRLEHLVEHWIEPGAFPTYYPVVATSFWLERHLWGLEPLGYHVTNILLHAANTLLLWLLLLRLGVPGAAFAALLFAVHPVNVLSVAWIAERKNVLSMLFALLSIGGCVRWFGLGPRAGASGRTRWRYGFALAAFALAMLSKPQVVAVPAVVLVMVWWKRGRVDRSAFAAMVPFLAVGLGIAAITASIEWTAGQPVHPDAPAGPIERVLAAGRACAWYVQRLVWPTEPAFIVGRWRIDAANPLLYLYPAAVAGVLGALVALHKRIGRGPAAAALVFVGSLVPVSGLLHFGWMRLAPVSDHYLYHSAPALFALAAAGAVPWLTTRVGPSIVRLGLAVGPLVLVLAGLTWSYADMFWDEERLWRDTLEHNPTSFTAHSNLAALLIGTGNFKDAASHALQAVDDNPASTSAWNNLGVALRHQRRYAEAEEAFREVLRLDPDHFQALEGTAGSLLGQGRPAAALPFLDRARALRPGHAVILDQRFRALEATGDIDGALAALDAIEPRTDDPSWHARSRARLLAALGRTADAQAHLEAALEDRPDDRGVLLDLAWSLATVADPEHRDPPRAVALAERALAGGLPALESWDVLAAALAADGRTAEAAAILEERLPAEDAPVTTDRMRAERVEAMRRRLERYRSGRPWVQGDE